jgi:hypothetical protein
VTQVLRNPVQFAGEFSPKVRASDADGMKFKMVTGAIVITSTLLGLLGMSVLVAGNIGDFGAVVTLSCIATWVFVSLATVIPRFVWEELLKIPPPEVRALPYASAPLIFWCVPASFGGLTMMLLSRRNPPYILIEILMPISIILFGATFLMLWRSTLACSNLIDGPRKRMLGMYFVAHWLIIGIISTIMGIAVMLVLTIVVFASS